MILCCGEALIDMLPRETTKGEAGFAPYAGGAVFNTAIALGRLGVETGFFTGLSDDMMGDILRKTLQQSHVDFSYCATLSRPTTIAFVKLVDGHATYAFYDENTAGRMITEADLPALGADCEALHFGAISLIPEPCGSTYESLMAREHQTRVISLDPNIRPGFIKDKASHLARIRRMAAMADIVKFSDEDLAWFGLEGNEETLARHWLHHGAKLVIVTRGAEGAAGYTAQHKVEVASEKVTVVDTVGAGDTFDAGVLASLKMQNLLTKQQVASLNEEQIAKALSLGSKAAAVTVSRAGANPPFAHEIGLS
ncbi:carbohydrate kinase [Allorhizobium sp. BGMRC 0089]|uniref:carbohydrate kinase family protein n=1 Tax=Allorhizobium sonneratiae TaxID=2934936 RepID=UPI002033C15B|nr:carbohydrate kinase [Allorhizobium sonneratiae]MCM2291534.1 carbohydrate kinase [Allorhizobium sonneratiae]